MKKKENHNIEFKRSWQETCMDVICAFANTNGGTLYVGKDDSGKTVGVTDSKTLMDEIPNKILSILGFSADVRLKKEKGKEVIEVKVKPQAGGISLRQKFYIRSGSNTFELKGTQLQNFILNKRGQKWEDLLEEKATFSDIDDETITRFKELTQTRFPAATKEKSLKSLLEKLHLFNHGKLTKAAIILFGKDPQKFYKSAHLKIGSFISETELKSTDIVEGNLFQQIEHVMSLLKNKYLNYSSRIEGLYRKEELEYPEEALREAIINSLIHRDYLGAHTQLRIDKDSLSLWNFGELPAELTIQRLKEKHKSLPRNPKIADIFYKAGLIESWGRGTTKIIEELTKAGLPEPVYENKDGGFSISFLKDVFTEEQLIKAGLSDRHIKAVQYLKEYGKITNKGYTEITDSSIRTATRDLSFLVKKKILVQTGTTGKGTEYTLRGHKGAKDAKKDLQKQEISKDATKTPKTPQDELDRKLSALDKKLELFDPEEELRLVFDKVLFLKILDSWFSDFFREVVPVIQKFNRYFVKPRHHIHTGAASASFVNEKPNDILKKLQKDCIANIDHIQSHQSSINISTSYGSLRKAGLETFAFHNSIEIKFLPDWYEVHMDDIASKKGHVLQFKRQYHKPITKTEAKSLAKKFGEVIYDHIDRMINEIKEKKTKGDTKGT